MSSYRYDWQPCVDRMIQNYPHRLQELEILGNQMPRAKRQELEAVREAVADLGQRPGGSEKLEFIRALYWSGSSAKVAVGAAASYCGVPEETATRWHRGIVQLVGKRFGYLWPWE